jgi:pimeloyl-ACP methyl ester carboxylesterase
MRSGCKKFFNWFGIGVLVTAVIITAFFLWWRRQEQVRLQAGSQLIETRHGLIEYTTFGEGPAVLVLHGTIGGYDQAQMLAEMLETDDFRFICVSRPGYLRTPLETGSTFEDQADAYAALLDALAIDQAAVMAISGGGPPALQLALRHPDRVSGLVMIAANSDVNAGREIETAVTDEGTSGPPGWLLRLIFSDFTSWLVTGLADWQPQLVLPALVGDDYVTAVLNDPVKYQLYTNFIDSFVLTSQRREGSFNEGEQFPHYTGYPFEKIQAPMLIVQGTADSADLIAQQHYLAETVPNAEYIAIEGGTHFMAVSHNDVIAPIVRDFLAKIQHQMQ